MSIVVALDNPYHAIYARSWAYRSSMRPLIEVEDDLDALAAMAIAACFGMWVVWTLYSGFDDADSHDPGCRPAGNQCDRPDGGAWAWMVVFETSSPRP